MSHEGLAAVCEDVVLRRIANTAGRTTRARRRIDLDILGRLIALGGHAASIREVIQERRQRGFHPPVGFKHRNQRQRRRDARRSGRPLQRNKGR